MQPESVYHGVDFSGSVAHQRKIWVSTLVEGETASTRRGFTHSALVDEISKSTQDERPHYWVIDAPSGLPIPLLEIHDIEPSWRASVEWLLSFPSPRDWRRACRARSRKEPRREADRRFKTPMPPTNIRLFKQTWHFIARVLEPLSHDDRIAILPMAVADARQSEISNIGASVAEGCPSSTLRHLEWPHTRYKGATEDRRAARRALLEMLIRKEEVSVDADGASAAIEDTDGDALDSLLLLSAARRFSDSDPATIAKDEPASTIEGWVYV